MANEIVDIHNKIQAVIRSDVSRRRAVSSIFGPHRERIFAQGKASDGSQIGTYSSKPSSIAKSQQARNTGRTFFPGGYSEYKSAVGKNPGYVILRNTDQMYADYGIIQNGGDYGFGFQNEFNAQKMTWMSEKYGKDIAQLTDDEFNKYVDILLEELNRNF